MPAHEEPTGTFRIFVSSTFEDFKAERDALHNYVFPEIRRVAREQGYRVDVIDLRWGISTEASIDHLTEKVCLDDA